MVKVDERAPAVRRRNQCRHSGALVRIVALAALATPVLVGCETNDGYGNVKVGARQARSGPEVIVYSCASRPVHRLVVRDAPKGSFDQGAVVWAIERPDGVPVERQTSVEIGTVPQGWRETTLASNPMPARLSATATYSKDRSDDVTFEIPELRRGSLKVESSWYGGRRYVSPERFASKNESACDAGF